RVDVSAGMAEIAQDPDADPSNGFGVGLFSPDNLANTTALFKLRYDYFLTDNDSLYAPPSAIATSCSTSRNTRSPAKSAPSTPSTTHRSARTTTRTAWSTSATTTNSKR